MLLNADKSDVVILSAGQQARKLPDSPVVNVAGFAIKPSDSTRSLVVVIDDRLTFNKQVNAMCQSCYYHIRVFRHIRSFLTHETALSVARCIVLSRLDYCNSLLFRISKMNIHKLQCVQNSLARLVLNLKPRSPAEHSLKILHWLPVEKRIKYKIGLLTFKCRNNLAPDYLSELMKSYVPVRPLRSSGADLMMVRRVNTELARSSFSSASSEVWNSLPPGIRSLESITMFKRQLKTFLFNS